MAVPIATRKSWGARYSDGDLTLTGLALEVFAHHTVTAQLSPTASIAAEQEQMRAIESVGQSRFGTGISYNVIIFPSGRAYQGVSFSRRGTHTGGRNSTARSICFAGNYETNKPTAAQLATASAIYHEGKGKWWRTAAPLRGHREVSQTACPGKNVYAQLPWIRSGKTATATNAATTEEAMTLNTTQAKQLSNCNHFVTAKIIPDFDGLQTVEDALRRLLIITRRNEAALSAQSAAMQVMATSVGVDPKLVVAAVEKAVTAALPASITVPLES